MDVTLSTVLSNLTPNLSPEMPLVGQLSLVDFLPQTMTLTAGETILLNFDGQGNLLITNSSGQQESISATNLTLNKNILTSEPLELAVKIEAPQNNAVQLQVLSVKTPQKSININKPEATSAIVKDISQPQSIPLKPLTLNEIAKPIINELPLSPQQKNDVQTALGQVTLKTQIESLAQPQVTKPLLEQVSQPVETKITEQIKTTLNNLPMKLATQPEQADTLIQTTVKEIVTQLQPFVGEKLPAIVENNVLKTNLGFIQPEETIVLPEALEVELQITNIIQTPKTHHQVLTPLENIVKSLHIIKSQSPQLYQQIIAKLPADNENMLANMTAFTKAAVKGDIKQWLGNEIVRQIENQGETGKALLNEFQNALQGSSRQTPTWRMIEIPYYADNQMEKIRLAIKQYPDEDENSENARQKYGTRFVVDTNFSKLGAFQFDGFSFAKDKRFDLIIRTEKYIGDDLCANMMRLFKVSLNDVGYSGNIKINLKENFIKISENTTDNAFTSRGVYI